MENSKLKISTMVCSLFFMGLTIAFAQEKRHSDQERHDPRPRMERDRGPRIPDLTEKQKEQLKVIRVKLQRETLPLKNELREKRARLQTLTRTEGTPEREVNKVIEDIGDLQTKMLKVRTAHHQEMKKFLTEEQRLFIDSRGVAKKSTKGKANRVLID